LASDLGLNRRPPRAVRVITGQRGRRPETLLLLALGRLFRGGPEHVQQLTLVAGQGVAKDRDFSRLGVEQPFDEEDPLARIHRQEGKAGTKFLSRIARRPFVPLPEQWVGPRPVVLDLRHDPRDPREVGGQQPLHQSFGVALVLTRSDLAANPQAGR
jgi:hypothetical protein